MTLNSGAGGTESCDWTNMLFRMYTMWAERAGHKVTVLNTQPGDVTGYRNVSLEISGDFVYGYLKGENGVHRLVRKSPFNKLGKRQTTFSSAFVYPLIDDTIEIDLNPSDIKMETFRASGAGGQHVNKTDSAVRLRHLPTGLYVECQQERSQHLNKEKAMKMLRSRLYEIELEKKRAEKQKVEDSKMKNEWGSQIRNYVLDSRRIKDLRTGHTVTNTQSVLDGHIDGFLNAYLLHGKISKETEDLF